MARRRTKQPDFGKFLISLISALFTALMKADKTSKATVRRASATPLADDEDWHGFNTEVVGEASYKKHLRSLFGPGDGRKYFDARLDPEPTNPHDASAIKVSIDGGIVGYLPRASAKRYGKKYAGQGNSCRAIIVATNGGLGIWLDVDL